ncbi:DUF6798 domain-containing protein [Rhodomicrobium vannielii]|nr:DUF6798 domain-containing protein [Rhodomicrobium vannielii]
MRLDTPSASEAGRGTQRLALLALALGPLFLAAWQMKPLYADNQNTKYLHALANAGFGQLGGDWLARTKDGLPLFTWLLEALYRGFGPGAFYAATLVSFTIFLFCALLIYDLIAKPRNIPPYGLAIFLAVLFALAAATDLQQLVFSGFAEQYILGGYFQTADFGVLLLAAIVLFVKRQLALAMPCIIVGAAMHPGYVVPGAMLLAIFTLYEAAHFDDAGRAAKIARLAICALGLAILMAISMALKGLFTPTDAQTQLEAHRILTDVRIPRHASLWVWLNQNVFIQFGLCLAAALLLPPGRLRFVIRLGLGAMAIFVLAAFLPHTETYRLIAPWRISVIMVPLASLSLCAVAIVRLYEAGRFGGARPARIMAVSAGVVLLCAAVGAGFTAAKFLKPAPAYESFVTANLAPGQHYLTGPSRSEFRLATGAPQYITFKSHPYQDVEVLEWLRRLRAAQALYAGDAMDCAQLQRVAREDAVTHVLVTGKTPAVACPFAAEIFSDGGAKIFRLEREKMATP